MSDDDQSFTGNCPTCGQRYLRARVMELEQKLERLGLVSYRLEEGAPLSKDAQRVIAEYVDVLHDKVDEPVCPVCDKPYTEEDAVCPHYPPPTTGHL